MERKAYSSRLGGIGSCGRLVALATMVGLSACTDGGGVTNPPPPVVVNLSTLSATIEVGKSVTLTASVSGPSGVSQGVVWTSEKESVASVSGGVVTGVGVGTTKVRALWSEDPERKAEATITVIPAISQTVNFSVRVGLLNGAVPNGMVAKVSWGAGESVAPIGFGNRATFSVPRSVISVTITVTGDIRYHDSEAQFQVFEGTEARFVMVPKEYVTPMGLGAGQTFPVDVEGMYEQTSDGSSWLVSPVSIVPPILDVASLPHTLCFDRAASNYPITAQDSVIMWAAVGEDFNGSFGMTVFRPGTFGSNCEWYWGVDTTLVSAGKGYARHAFLKYPPTHPFWLSKSPGYQTLAIIHELFHSLGFGHTCSWQSAMYTVGCPIASSRFSVGDVSMFHLLRETQLLEQSMGGGTASFRAALQASQTATQAGNR